MNLVLRQLLKILGFAAAVLALAPGLGFDTVPQRVEGAAAWNVASPEEVGLDSGALSEMFDYVRDKNVRVHSVQIVRHGKLVLDAYFYPYSPEMRHDVASVTKSVTSTLIGLAIQKGYLHD